MLLSSAVTFSSSWISASALLLFNAEDPLEHDSDPLIHAIDSEIPDPNAETIREAILPKLEINKGLSGPCSIRKLRERREKEKEIRIMTME